MLVEFIHALQLVVAAWILNCHVRGSALMPSKNDEASGSKQSITAESISLRSNSLADNSKNSTERVYLESFYSITCCRGGRPALDASISQHAIEFESQFVGSFFVDHQRNITCDRYNGKYRAPINVTTNDKDFSSGVTCLCAEPDLDRNCRQIRAECQNGGYRAFSINLRCVCPGQYFGDLCEKYCLNGRLERNEQNVVDKCTCRPNFYGEQCEKIVCYNSGTPVNGRGCSCPPFILGPHCETRIGGSAGIQYNASLGEWIRGDGSLISAARSSQNSEFRRQIWDATGAGASVVLLMLLIGFSLYYYAGKRRRQRCSTIGSNEVDQSRTGDAQTREIATVVENGLMEMLAPLPTYEQAIKSATVYNMPRTSAENIVLNDQGNNMGASSGMSRTDEPTNTGSSTAVDSHEPHDGRSQTAAQDRERT